MTIAGEIDTLENTKSAIKASIIAKGVSVGSSDGFSTYPAKINSIQTVNNNTLSITPTTSAQSFTPSSPYTGYGTITVNAVTSSIDANIVAGNIKSGVTILGVIGNLTALNGETRTETLTSSAGNTFTPSTGKNGITSITVTPNNQARSVTPTTSQQILNVNSGYSGNGVITVNAVTSAIDANIVAGNIKDGVTILGVTGTVAEVNNTTLSVTPTTSAQSIGAPASPYTGYDSISVSAVDETIDSNITAENIASGVSILGVSGSATVLSGETKNVSLTNASGQTFTPGSGYNGITSITVTPNNEARTVTPTTSQQSLSVNTGYSGNGTITVNAVTSSIDSNIVAGNIKSGVSILGVNGTLTELKGETRSVSITSSSGNTFTPSTGKNGITSITVTPTNQAKTITPTTSQQSISVPSGYSGFGTLTVDAVTSAIDANIVAGNIKDGVTILGVTGTHSGGALQTKTLTVGSSTATTVTIEPDNGYYGLDEVTVDMSYIEDELDNILGNSTVPIGSLDFVIASITSVNSVDSFYIGIGNNTYTFSTFNDTNTLLPTGVSISFSCPTLEAVVLTVNNTVVASSQSFNYTIPQGATVNISFLGVNCCLLYDTPVNYFDGSTKIAEEVQIGDKLLGYDIDNDEFVEVEVLKVIHKLRTKLVKITTDSHEIEITPDHPILTNNGWAVYDINASNYEDIDKVQLSTDLKVLTIDGEYEDIKSIEYIELDTPVDTYTFDVTNSINTYVANGLISHNAPC